MIISIVAIVLAVAALVYTGHLAIVYQRFNDGIKDWANALDESTRAAIDRQAMEILRELDDRFSEGKLSEGKQEETDVTGDTGNTTQGETNTQ